MPAILKINILVNSLALNKIKYNGLRNINIGNTIRVLGIHVQTLRKKMLFDIYCHVCKRKKMCLYVRNQRKNKMDKFHGLHCWSFDTFYNFIMGTK